MKTIIFGTRDIASLARFYLHNDSIFEPIAFCVDGSHMTENTYEGLPVVPFEEVEKSFPPSDDFVFFAPLYSNKLRKVKVDQIVEKKYRLASYISSKATIWSAIKGRNCFVLENNVIQPFVEIGDNAILWSGNHIGHHSKIGNNVFFSSHVVLSGNCTVEDNCWFGVNSSIRDGLTIAENTLVGMGSVVVKNTEPNKTYIGNPAEIKKDVD